MSLLLTLEQGPRTQAVRQTRLDEGELVIGRSADAGWQINDPDMFVSRAHCRITGGRDGYFVTDTSSSGLYINDSDSPLGAGQSTRLQSGMRLRLGDYVVHVDLQTPTAQAQPASQPVPERLPPGSRAPLNIGSDDFFSAKIEEEPRRPRPADLPNPFEQPVAGAFERAASSQRSSPAFDDPFSLDPVSTPVSKDAAAYREPGGAASQTDPFSLDPAPSLGAVPNSLRESRPISVMILLSGQPPQPVRQTVSARPDSVSASPNDPPIPGIRLCRQLTPLLQSAQVPQPRQPARR